MISGWDFVAGTTPVKEKPSALAMAQRYKALRIRKTRRHVRPMQRIAYLFRNLNRSFWGRWFLFAIIIGIVAGLAAVALQFLVESMQHVTLSWLAGHQPQEAAGEHSFFTSPPRELRVWMILPIITFGGLLTGLLVFTFAPGAQGHGTDGAIDAFHNRRGVIPLRIPVVKAIASAITLGTGGSAGREGPIAQIGAGFGSFLAQRLKLSAHDRRIHVGDGHGSWDCAIFAAAVGRGDLCRRDHVP